MDITLVVDAYNAINAIPAMRKELKKGLYQARKAILELSKEYARSSGYITKIKVVFDGDSRHNYLGIPGAHGDGTQVFSETGEGDETIIRTIKKCVRYGRVVLASNDNYVRNNARAYGASIIASDELAGKKKKIKIPRKHEDKKICGKVQDRITAEYKKELGL